MSTLYKETMANIESTTYIEYDKLKEYFFEVMKDLSIKNNDGNYKLYVLKYHYGNIYFHVDLHSIKFSASNKYELWLKIYDYFMKNSKPNKYGYSVNFEEMIQGSELESDFCEELEYTNNKYDAMVNVIDEMLDIWIHGDTLWWKEDISNIII